MIIHHDLNINAVILEYKIVSPFCKRNIPFIVNFIKRK